jgi:hypothetical protein
MQEQYGWALASLGPVQHNLADVDSAITLSNRHRSIHRLRLPRPLVRPLLAAHARLYGSSASFSTGGGCGELSLLLVPTSSLV